LLEEGHVMRQVRSFRLLSRFRESSVAIALTLALFGTGLCDPAQAKIIKFDFPESNGTLPLAINASRWITGWYVDVNGNTHSFLRAPDGTYTTIDVEGATCGTDAKSINRSGVMVGAEFDS